jgi:8-oxo-dGTP pyrophosphatase MutT (NUDIX family)
MIDLLRQRLTQPLPGSQAQFQMSSRHFEPHVLQELYQNLPPNHRPAAVTILLFYRQNVLHTALMQRPEDSHAHSNEVSLPGGRYDDTDPDILYTARREMQEEFGVKPESVEILGALTPIYIPVSNILVSPFVGFAADPNLQFSPDPKEVVEILETPLDWLFESHRRKTTTITRSNGAQLQDIPYFDLHDRIVWGATAMILSEFVACLSDEI